MLKAGKIREDSSRRWLVIVNLVLLRNGQNNKGEHQQQFGSLSPTKSKQFDTI
jgi:hypothetical protein